MLTMNILQVRVLDTYLTLEGDHGFVHTDGGMRTVHCQELLVDKVQHIL